MDVLAVVVGAVVVVDVLVVVGDGTVVVVEDVPVEEHAAATSVSARTAEIRLMWIGSVGDEFRYLGGLAPLVLASRQSSA